MVLKTLLDIPRKVPNDEWPINTERVAHLYNLTQHEPCRSSVASAYSAFKRDLREQYEWLNREGYQILPWTVAGQPYKTSEDLFADARLRGKLYVFLGGTLPQDHPLTEAGPDGFTFNEIFRGVHDYLGHAARGYPFETLEGEIAAYREHSGVFSYEARPALFTETVAQTCAYYFGGGRFPEQKAGIVEVR